MSADPVAALSADVPRARRKKRSAPIAFLLSVIAPGLGQLYATATRRGVWMLCITLALTGLIVLLVAMPPRSLWQAALVLVLLAATVLYRLGAAIDAWRVARRAGVAPLTRWNRVWIYLAVCLGLTLGLEAARPTVERWKVYTIPAASMQPTLMVGDWVVSWKGYFADHAPQAGDLVVFKLPRDNTTDYVKRIVGLPGQRIQMRAGRLAIDDVVVARTLQHHLPADHALDRHAPVIEYVETLPNGVSYRIHETGDAGPLDETPVYTVPPDHVFVMGDNRDNSIDSRVQAGAMAVGFVPFGNLRDRPRVVVWSRDRGRIGLGPR